MIHQAPETGFIYKEIFVFHTKNQKDKWLMPIAKGKKGAFGLTEPNSGSDAGTFRTKAIFSQLFRLAVPLPPASLKGITALVLPHGLPFFRPILFF